MAGEIFISYRRADEPHARLLYNRLKDLGVEAWYDAHVGAGEDWRTSTARALQNARIFVLLFSRAAAASDDITKELAAATFSKKLIVPVRLEDIQPEGAFLYELAGRNWINAYEETDAKLGELARSLAQLVKAGKEDPAMLPFDRSVGGSGKATKKAAKGGVNWTVIAVSALVLTAIVAATWIAMKGPPEKAAAPAAAGPAAQRAAVFGFGAQGDDARLSGVANSATDLAFSGLAQERVETAARTATLGVPADQRFAKAQEAGATYAVSGDVRAEGEADVVAFRIEDVASRTVLLEEVVTEAGARRAFAAQRATALLAVTLRCLNRQRPQLRRDDLDVVRLIARTCRDVSAGGAPNVQAWRELVGKTEDSPLMQAAFVGSIAPWVGAYPAPMQQGLLETAEAAAKRVEAAPETVHTHMTRYYLARWKGEPLKIHEEHLLAALKAAPDYGWANYWYSLLLNSVGRNTEAINYAVSASADDPLMPTAALRQGAAAAALGGTDLAAISYRQALTVGGEPLHWSNWIVASLFWGADEPETVIALAPEFVIEASKDCWRQMIGPAAERRNTGRRFASSTFTSGCGPRSLASLPPTLFLSTLVGLGDWDAVAAMGDTFRGSLLGNTTALFMPGNADFRADPRFEQLAEQVGLMAYWRDTGRRPDFCWAGEAAPVCKTLGPSTQPPPPRVALPGEPASR